MVKVILALSFSLFCFSRMPFRFAKPSSIRDMKSFDLRDLKKNLDATNTNLKQTNERLERLEKSNEKVSKSLWMSSLLSSAATYLIFNKPGNFAFKGLSFGKADPIRFQPTLLRFL